MNREEFEAIMTEVNEAKCESLHAVEDECALFYAAKPQLVAGPIDVDKHRWYEIATNVYQIGDWFLGISGCNDLFSEQMSWDDVGDEAVAFEMKAVESVSYVAVKL